MQYVAIGLSDELLAALASPSGDLSRAVLEALATEAYREGKISHSQLRRLLGLQTRTEADGFSMTFTVFTSCESSVAQNTC